MPPTRVLLADDHDLFREGLAGILDAEPDFEVVGEARDGVEALVEACSLRPDLVLLDVRMPGGNGVEAASRIRHALPDTVVVMLTVSDEDEDLFAAVKGGAMGYVLKSVRTHDLLTMLRGVVRGEAAMTPDLAARLLEEFRQLSRRVPDDAEQDAPTLTPREKQVLSLVALGRTDQEIAAELVISIHTAKSHMRNILATLHMSHRHQAALYALRTGLIPPPIDEGSA
jgi:two-component system NarL family response regulator